MMFFTTSGSLYYAHVSRSGKDKMRSAVVAHIEDEVCTKALDELVVPFGSGCHHLVPGKLG